MMAFLVAAIVALLTVITPASGALKARDFQQKVRSGIGMEKIELGNDHLDIVGNSTFDQLLDHNDLRKGTFSQRFWWNAEFYEEGGPIILYLSGEVPADGMLGYLTESVLPGYYAKQLKGAAILLEHRYWGESVPFDKFTTETLQYLNLPNIVKDLTNFARNVDCEFCENGTCNSDENPWVLVAGSYSGALVAWTSQIAPGTFAAYHASSAVVEAIHDFWQYYGPIEAALPRWCSKEVKSVIQYVDSVLLDGEEDDVSQLKARFGLKGLNNADFAYILSGPIMQWKNHASEVLNFCAQIETSNTTTLDAYASYIKDTSNCGPDGDDCNTYSPDIVWDEPVVNEWRPWWWMLCNEPFGWYFSGTNSSDGPGIVSSALQADYTSRRCALMFPEVNGFTVGSLAGWKESHLNTYTGGWDAKFEKVIFVNGEYDPWKSATLSSEYRLKQNGSGGHTVSYNTTEAPVFVVKDGIHCPEFVIDEDNPYTWPIVQSSVDIMRRWIKEWSPPSKKNGT